MRVYSAIDEETLRVRRLLKDWFSAGFLSDAQRARMERDMVCNLRRTNGALRVVLFLFTLGSAAAAVALYFALFSTGYDMQNKGMLLMAFAAISYLGAEFAVFRARLYRHGIEEALAILAVLFLCVGLWSALFTAGASRQGHMIALIPAVGAIASFLTYCRFGFSYAFLTAMIFAAFLPAHWIDSPEGMRVALAVFYAIALWITTRVRRAHAHDAADEDYSIVEALLWFGLYLTVNLQLSSAEGLTYWRPDFANTYLYAKPFYWATYVFIWCLPIAMLRRALSRKDRPLLGFGVIMALLTLVANKPYLGWPRHPWDPMLLGILLVGIVLAVRRWLAQGPAGVRDGFTAQRFSSRDKHVLGALSAASAWMSPPGHASAPTDQGTTFGGGSSGGGGASSNF